MSWSTDSTVTPFRLSAAKSYARLQINLSSAFSEGLTRRARDQVADAVMEAVRKNSRLPYAERLEVGQQARVALANQAQENRRETEQKIIDLLNESGLLSDLLAFTLLARAADQFGGELATETNKEPLTHEIGIFSPR